MSISNRLRAARQAESVGQIGKALQLCQEVLFLNPMHVEALLLLGLICIRQGRLQEGELALRKAHAADAQSFDAARWLATLLMGRADGKEAVQFGLEATLIRPSDPHGHVALGLAALGAGNNSLAISAFQRAIELNPKMAGAYHNLGVAFQRDEAFEDAILALQKAVELSPGSAETLLHLGRSYLANRQGEESLACAEKVLAVVPDSLSALRLRADASFAAATGDNGEEIIRKAIEADPQSGFAYAILGSRLQELGDFDQAEDALRTSIRLRPNQGLAYYLFANNRKMTDEDRLFFQSVLPLAEDNRFDRVERQYLNYGLGKLFDDLKEYGRAIHHFDLANEELEGPVFGGPSLDSQKYARRVRRYIDIFTPEFLDRHQGLGLDSGEPIFIFGMPRSGTTLIEQIVSRHSQVGAAGEQSFWRDRSQRVISMESGEIFPEELRLIAERYLHLLRKVAPGFAHVTDKFPSNYVYLGILHLAFPNAKFIHARRHPIDTCLSIYMRPFSTIQEVGRTRARIVETYQLYRESMAHWRKVLPPGRFLDVDYENLVQNQEAVSREIIRHCGLEWEEECLTPQSGDRRVVTFSKWQVRQPVYKTSMERWRNYEAWLGSFRDLLIDVP